MLIKELKDNDIITVNKVDGTENYHCMAGRLKFGGFGRLSVCNNDNHYGYKLIVGNKKFADIYKACAF